MTIRVSCSACGVKLKADERHAGKSISCPACKQPISIPSATMDGPLDPFADDAAAMLAPPAPKPVSPSRPSKNPADPMGSNTPLGSPQKKSKPRPSNKGLVAPPTPPPPTQKHPATPQPSEDFLPPEDLAEETTIDSGFPDLTEDDLVQEVISPPRKKRQPVTTDDRPTPSPRPQKRRQLPESPPVSWRMHLHWLLILALVPLAISMVHPSSGMEEMEQRIQQSLNNHPEVDPAFLNEASSLHEIAMQFPDHRIDGALLAADTYLHWGIAIVSAGLFLSLFLVMWPGRNSRLGVLILMGIGTGTIGILLLLGFQWVAIVSQGVAIRGRGVVAILFLIVKFIGFSYRSALTPGNGFLESFFGFTFGVGLCEELCKALPVAMYLTGDQRPSARMTCLVGLASGVGFGVSEGITYSADYYNGVQDLGIYLVRFLSCVSLHAIWSGGVAILMYRNQDHLEFSWEGAFHFVVFYLLVAMILHGAYDTLLKQDREILAVVTALVSFGWFQWLVSRTPAES